MTASALPVDVEETPLDVTAKSSWTNVSGPGGADRRGADRRGGAGRVAEAVAVDVEARRVSSEEGRA